jgi:hypothetical protein
MYTLQTDILYAVGSSRVTSSLPPDH